MRSSLEPWAWLYVEALLSLSFFLILLLCFDRSDLPLNYEFFRFRLTVSGDSILVNLLFKFYAFLRLEWVRWEWSSPGFISSSWKWCLAGICWIWFVWTDLSEIVSLVSSDKFYDLLRVLWSIFTCWVTIDYIGCWGTVGLTCYYCLSRNALAVCIAVLT